VIDEFKIDKFLPFEGEVTLLILPYFMLCHLIAKT